MFKILRDFQKLKSTRVLCIKSSSDLFSNFLILDYIAGESLLTSLAFCQSFLLRAGGECKVHVQCHAAAALAGDGFSDETLGEMGLVAWLEP